MTIQIIGCAEWRKFRRLHPKMTNLQVDVAGTKKLRAAMQQARSIKITINIDAEA